MSDILKDEYQATGMDKTQVIEIRRNIPTSPLTKILLFDLEKARALRAITATPKTIEEFHYERGVKEGLQIAEGILKRKPTV